MIFSALFGKKKSDLRANDSLSEFLSNTSEEEKNNIFREVAQKTNQDQRDTFARSLQINTQN